MHRDPLPFASPAAHKFTIILRTICAAGILLALSGCGTRPGPEVLEITAAPASNRQVTIYVATTRAPSDSKSPGYKTDRAASLNHARYTISIPPSHQPGVIEWPKNGKPDPEKSFAVVSQSGLASEAFRAEITASARRYPKEAAPIGIFVHGFNFNFQESLFRFAQLSADADIEGVPILFSWPSRAAVTGYLADKDSVTYSRDYLADLLIDVTRSNPGRRVMLFGHSMGGWLVTETLRQLKLSKRDDVLAKLNVVLAAPDIDRDVFRQQVKVIGPLSPPMTILVSKDDRALQASGLIAGNTPRVGALDISDPSVQEAARQESVRLVDISTLAPGDRINHDRYVNLAVRYPSFTSSQDQVTIGQVGAFVFDAAAATVSSPFRLVSAAINPQ